MNLVAQLELIGGMSQWAVYVAAHLPDAALREETVRSLLSRHAPEWAAEPHAARAFLVDRLGMPSSWLELALAAHEHYCHKVHHPQHRGCFQRGFCESRCCKWLLNHGALFKACKRCRYLFDSFPHGNLVPVMAIRISL